MVAVMDVESNSKVSVTTTLSKPANKRTILSSAHVHTHTHTRTHRHTYSTHIHSYTHLLSFTSVTYLVKCSKYIFLPHLLQALDAALKQFRSQSPEVAALLLSVDQDNGKIICLSSVPQVGGPSAGPTHIRRQQLL